MYRFEFVFNTDRIIPPSLSIFPLATPWTPSPPLNILVEMDTCQVDSTVWCPSIQLTEKYTPYPTGKKHTISTSVDQTHIQLTRPHSKIFFFKTSLPVKNTLSECIIKIIAIFEQLHSMCSQISSQSIYQYLSPSSWSELWQFMKEETFFFTRASYSENNNSS